MTIRKEAEADFLEIVVLTRGAFGGDYEVELIETGLESLRDRGYEAVIVLGRPNYYPRFGFSLALTTSLAAPFSGRAFMGLELVPGSLSGSKGSVKYPDAFGI